MQTWINPGNGVQMLLHILCVLHILARVLCCQANSHKRKQEKERTLSEIILQVEKSAKDKVIDIDADTSDPVTVSEYTNEIFVNMKRREVCSPTFILLPCYSLVVTPKNIPYSLEAVAYLTALGPDEQIELSCIPPNSGAKFRSGWTWYYSRFFLYILACRKALLHAIYWWTSLELSYPKNIRRIFMLINISFLLHLITDTFPINKLHGNTTWHHSSNASHIGGLVGGSSRVFWAVSRDSLPWCETSWSFPWEKHHSTPWTAACWCYNSSYLIKNWGKNSILIKHADLTVKI